MEEKELFEDYELKGWKLTPRLWKILGAAAILELSVFLIVGQFNLLQTKACDNAYVGKVCQVLDGIYVASTFLGKDNGWADKDYVKKTIDDADIAYVDVTNQEPPFTYPDGYFELVSPEKTTEILPTDNSSDFTTGFTMSDPNKQSDLISPDRNLINRKPVLPKPNRNVVKGNIPDSPFDFGDEKSTIKPTVPKQQTTAKVPKTTPKLNNDSPKTLPKTGNDNTTAKKQGNDTDANTNKDVKKADDPTTKQKTDDELAAFQPNKKPLEDFRDEVKDKLAKKEVDLKAPFSITVDGYLTKDGKFDLTKTRFINPQGDPKMVDLAKSGIEAINNSGLFVYLDKLNDKRIVITLQQDKDNIVAIVKSQVETAEKAKTIASGFNALISIGKMSRKGKDEEVLLDSAKVTNDGKVFIINFALPQQAAQDLIQKQLLDTGEKKSENGIATNNTNAKIVK